MFVRFFALLTLLLALAGAAQAQRPTVPDAFRGEWAGSPDRCYLPHDANLSISEGLFGFRPMPGVVEAIREISDLELEVELHAADGGLRESRRFALSADRRTLTDLTDRSNPVARIRCDMARQRIIGLVEIPALHASLNEGTSDATTAPVTLHVEPQQDSAVAVTIRDRRQLVSLEHGYEQVSAAVYSRHFSGNDTWYRLGYAVGDKTGFGWLNPAAVGRFRSVHALVSDGLTYLTRDWDRRLRAQPDSEATPRPLDSPDRDPDWTPGARVLGIWTERATGEDWYLVAVMRDVCESGPPEVLATGWVRAYAPNGANTVWYYSRGC